MNYFALVRMKQKQDFDIFAHIFTTYSGKQIFRMYYNITGIFYC